MIAIALKIEAITIYHLRSRLFPIVIQQILMKAEAAKEITKLLMRMQSKIEMIKQEISPIGIKLSLLDLTLLQCL
jgi:aspartokinase